MRRSTPLAAPWFVAALALSPWVGVGPAGAAEEVDAAVGLTLTIPLGETAAQEPPTVGMTTNVEGGWSEPVAPVDAPSADQGADMQRLVEPAMPDPGASEPVVETETGTTGASATGEPSPLAAGEFVPEGQELYLPPDILSGAIGLNSGTRMNVPVND